VILEQLVTPCASFLLAHHAQPVPILRVDVARVNEMFAAIVAAILRVRGARLLHQTSVISRNVGVWVWVGERSSEVGP